ncbi:ABC transporter permease [Spiroplasma endosymbiont of Glossina fuscipes fuscipes]|uniref:ABC transporter permease n=1 Tax=Spiroplasma endosymbiont of Glossina fuscipes fuscipes TaxID=2004463 RepID=UPI003C72471F
MKSNDIKILKIKPIKQGLLDNQDTDYQEPSLITKSHFFSGENSHFFNNGFFATKPSLQKQMLEQNYSFSLTQCRELNLNLDNPDALRVLHNQVKKLEQEKTNFHQRLDKIKATFDEKALFHYDSYLQEPPVITKKVDLNHFNYNPGHRPLKDERINVDRTLLKAQARAIAQKIVQKTEQESPDKTTEIVVKNETVSEPKSILAAHFPKVTTINPAPKKDIIVTQSYNNKTQKQQNSSWAKSQPFFANTINLGKQEPKFEQTNTSEQSTAKPEDKGINLKVSLDCASQVYDETDVMEWDITKRPNLGLDHTTNKYYHQEETPKKEEDTVTDLSLEQKDDSETSRAIEIDEPVGSYRINNFYTSLFDTPLPAAKSVKPAANVKIKRIRGKKQDKHVNSNDEELTQENKKNTVQATTFFSNSYKIQQLPNERQKISKIRKNNIITWRNPVILTARIIAIVGLILLCSTFLIFNNWINNSSLDLYNFITTTFGKFDFIQTNEDYLLSNRLFMIILLSVYAIVIILPFSVIPNFKIQLFLFLPLGLLFLGAIMGIALYGYFYKNNNFVLTSSIMQIVSYSFLILANILMLIEILYLKRQKR